MTAVSSPDPLVLHRSVCLGACASRSTLASSACAGHDRVRVEDSRYHKGAWRSRTIVSPVALGDLLADSAQVLSRRPQPGQCPKRLIRGIGHGAHASASPIPWTNPAGDCVRSAFLECRSRLLSSFVSLVRRDIPRGEVGSCLLNQRLRRGSPETAAGPAGVILMVRSHNRGLRRALDESWRAGGA